MMRTLMFALVAFVLWWAAPPAVADECWIHTPPGYQGIGGKSKIGPYPDWYAANRVNNEYFKGQGRIECIRDELPFKYGAVKIHNRTSVRMTFSIRASPGGRWQRATVDAGSWHWWWQECPCRFHCTWDGSLSAGNQRRTREVYWYGYQRQPRDADARDWQFVERGTRIDLIPGASEPLPRAKPRPTSTVSFVGSGEGRVYERTHRKAKVGNGTWKLTFMPRVRGVIPTLQGTWHLQWKRIVGRRDARTRVEVWNLSMSGFTGPGKGRQATDVTLRGGAGTASFFTTGVPGNPAAGKIRFKVHIQMSGSNVRLSFTRAY